MAYTSKTTFANIAASSTDAALITAVPGKALRVQGFIMVTAATATNVTFNTKPSGGGTAISCLFANGSNGGVSAAFNFDGWFTTNAGEGLTVTTGAGSTTGVQVSYIEI